MGKGKGFSSFDYTYGVGMEFKASSAKQVKDELKLNLETLSKLVKSYGKVLKIDPNADLSKLYDEMHKIKGIVDGINSSNNSFSNFVDKGVLSRISSLEESMLAISKSSQDAKGNILQLSEAIKVISDPLKSAGQAKFPATFKNLFGDVTDQTSKIKSITDELNRLKSSIQTLKNSKRDFDDSLFIEFDNLNTEDIKKWFEEFQQLRQKISDGIKNGINLSDFESDILKLSSLGQKLNSTLATITGEDFESLFNLNNKQANSFYDFLNSIPNKIDSVIEQIERKKVELNKQIAELQTTQSAYGSKQSISAKNIGVQSDYTAQVKINPKTNESEWVSKINDVILNIEAKLNPVKLTPTFSKSKNIQKEVDGNLASINHAINVDLKVDSNIEKFNEQIKNIDTSIKNAKRQLESNGNFKIKFEYEEGGKFKDAAYKIINKFKKIEANFYISNGKKFIQDVSGLREKSKKELKDIPASVVLGNQDKVLSSVDSLRSEIDKKIGNIGINLNINNIPQFTAQTAMAKDIVEQAYGKSLGVANNGDMFNSGVESSVQNVNNLSDAAKNAINDLQKCKTILHSLMTEKFNSNEFLNLGDITTKGTKVKGSTEKIKKILQEYNDLQNKINTPKYTREDWYNAYPQANGKFDNIKRLIQEDESRLKQLESELNLYYQKQIAYTQARISANEKILETEKKISNIKTNNVVDNTSSDLSENNQKVALNAEDAIKKQEELNSKIEHSKKILNDLNKNSFNSSYFTKIGNWDQATGSFKKDSVAVQELLDKYKELKRVRSETGNTNISKEERSLRGQLSSILQQQKKHIAEIVVANQNELDSIERILSKEKQISNIKQEQVNTKKVDESSIQNADKLSTSADDAIKKIRSLNGTLVQQKKILKDLETNGINSKSLVRLGEWDKNSGSFKKNSAEIQQLVDKYTELKKVRENSGEKSAVGEEASLRGKLSSILVQQKKHVVEIIEANQKELASLKQINEARKESATSKKNIENIKADANISKTTKDIEQLTVQLNKARDALELLKSKKFDALTVTGLGDIKQRLSSINSGQSFQDLINEYNALIAKRNELEKTGMDITHPEYVAYAKQYQGIEQQLNIIYNDQIQYAESKVSAYSKQIEQARQLLQIESQRTEAQKQASIGQAGDIVASQTTVTIDGSTLGVLAKDSTLASIDGKVTSILNSLGNGVNITGANVVIDSSNVTMSGGVTVGSATTIPNANEKLAVSAESATIEQRELNGELEKTGQIVAGISSSVQIVNEQKNEIKKTIDTFRSADRVLERQEVSGWVSHGKDEPATFEHIATVYKTNMDAYNKMYDNFVSALSKQKTLEQQIASANGPTSKLQAELQIQTEITSSLEAQLQQYSNLYTAQAKQAAMIEATKKSQQEMAKILGSQSDRDINQQNTKIANIVYKAQDKLSSMQNIVNNSTVPMADNVIAKVEEYEQLLVDLKAKQIEIFNNKQLLQDENYKTGFTSLLDQMQVVETAFNKLQSSSNTFISHIKSFDDIKILDSAFDPGNLGAMHTAMQKFAEQVGVGKTKLIEFNDAERSATFEINNGKGQVQQLTVQYDEATNSLGRYISKTKESQSEMQKFISSLKHSFGNVARYVASFGSVYRLFYIVKQGFTYVKDIDTALTNLKKVTDETDETYGRFLQNMSKTAGVVGSTVKDLTTMASEWARLGYSLEDAGKLAESTAILLNVSEFQDATAASEALISTMQAFSYTADESQHVVDILNEVGNNYAVSSDGIATALQDSASALMEAGNNFEQSVALVAAANKVVQDPNSVGSALRTISLRLRGTSVEVLEELGEETDGAAESISKMQAKLKALTGVDILTDSGAYKDTYTILKDIANVWDDMSSMDQAAALELMAGKNRANTLAAILNNIEDLEGAYESALDAEGSALRENATYLDSIQGKIDLFKNSVQTMWMNFIDSNVIKFIVSFGTKLIGLIDKVGVLNSALIGIGASLAFKNKANIATILGIDAASQAVKTVESLVSSGVVNYQKYADAIRNVSAVKQAEILINSGLSQSEQTAILTKTLGSEAAAAQAIAEAKLAAVHTSVSASIIGELVNTEQLTAEQGAAIVSTLGLVSAEGESIPITKAAALAKLEDAVATGVLSVEEKEAIVSAIGLSASNGVATFSFNALTASIWGAVKAIGAFLVSNPVGWIILAAGAITAAIGLRDLLTTSHEEYVEQLDEETQSLKSVQSELESVNNELKNTNDRIAELKSKGTLSFVEEEELNRLKAQNSELERQEKILAAQEKREKEKQIQTALKAVESDPNFKEKPLASGQVAESHMNEMKAQGYDIYDNEYESNLKKLAQSKQDLADAEKALLDSDADVGSKEYKTLYKNYENAKNAVQEYNQALDDLDKDWKTKYGEIGYVENATEEYEKQWNEIWRQHQDYLDQQALLNDTYGKSTILDRVFSNTGTNAAKEFKEKFESGIQSGKNPADVIEELISSGNYSSMLSDLENKFKITAENIKGYFAQTGEFAADTDFDITKYTKAISSHSAMITEYQEAIQSLDKGSFTMDDFMALIEKYPDLAKGVDISSNAFYGLSRNLNKAIKTSTKSFINDLKNLKKSLEAAGKSTENIDQLIEAIENMPDDALDGTIEKYQTLADQINKTKLAQDKLLASMEENPNEGFETRGEAMEYMKSAMERGEIGSESNLWNVAEQYGFTYNSAKSINENADALATFIAKREQWFEQDDDGNYKYDGTEEFIKDVESAVEANERLAEILKWNYDEKTGAFEFDFDNENFDEIVSLLAETDELVGLTSAEFTDLMHQIGQYFGINWSDNKDALDHLKEIADGAGDATDKLKEYAEYMQLYFGKGDVDLTNRPEVDSATMREAGWEAEDGSYATVNSVTYYKSDFENVNEGEEDTAIVLTPILPDGSVLSPDKLTEYAGKILSGEEIDVEGITLGIFDDKSQLNDFEEYLHQAQELYHSLQDPLKINTTIAEDGLNGLIKIKELQGSVKDGSRGMTILDVDALTETLEAAGYTEEKINALIAKIQEYNNVVTISHDDPLGLNSQNQSITTIMDSLDQLGIQYTITRGTLSNPGRINIQSTDFIQTMKDSGWTPYQISEYLQTLTSTENGFNVTVDGKVDMNTDEVNEAITEVNSVPEVKNVEVNITGNGLDVSKEINEYMGGITDRTASVTINETIRRKTMTYNPGTGEWELSGAGRVNGTAHVEGNAYQSGSWGASQTETALVGELGPELVVRGSKWFTVGDNGAEFTQVKKGDIIFNHKQTESLLKNGYIASRGRAYAEGTAYISGGSRPTRYTFNGDGTWDSSDLSDLSDSLSDAASNISDSAEEFKEVFDWIEVRIEELDEVLSLLEAQLENASNYIDKNNIIDDMISVNKTKLTNLEAGYKEYADYAAELLTEIPKKYREAAQDGSIAITSFVDEADEATIEAIENYRDWAQKSADLKQQAEEILTTIRDLAIQKFDNAYEYGESKANIYDSKNEKIQNAIDYDEEKGLITSEKYYIEMMENIEDKIKDLTETRTSMQDELDRAVKAGEIKKYSNEWYELVEQMYEIDASIDEATIELEEFQNAINDIYWDNLDELVNRLDYLSNETENLIDLMSNSDMVKTPETDDGWSADQVEWTEEGLTTLGLYAQQMEIAEYKAKQYAIAIDDLEKAYKAGKYSESEYLEKLNELKDAQYESIEAYYDAQDAIQDLNKTRIDEIKNGINKEIDAYKELIDKQKELLNSEKDLHDFEKSVSEKQKDISEIQRKIDSLANDSSISATAKRRQLEAELAEAQYELEEIYYDQSIKDKQDMLDKELETFQEEKDAEIEKWDEYLDNLEQIIKDSLGIVKDNASGIYDTLTEKAGEYNLTISDAVTTPWQDGVLAISDYQDSFDKAMSSTTDQLDILKRKWQEVIDKMATATESNIYNIDKENAGYEAATLNNSKSNTSTQKKAEKSIAIGGKVNAGSSLIYSDAYGSEGYKQYYSGDPIYVVLDELNGYLKVRHHSLSSGVTGWLKKKDVKAYAKGTMGVEKDQLALIDELGEELQLIPDGNGRLAYLKKGTAVLNNQITERLMDLAMNPQDMLDNSRPSIGINPDVHNTEVNISMDIAEVVHIDTVTNETIPNLTKAVEKQIDSYMKKLNSEIRKYAR